MSVEDIELISKYDDYPALLPTKSGIYIGAHLSLPDIFSQMRDLEADAAAFFVTSPQSWQLDIRELREKAEQFYAHASRNSFLRDQFLPHGPYLLNLISLEERVKDASVRRLVVEMFAVRLMGLDKINIHPGTGDVNNFAAIVEAIDLAHEIVPDVVVVLETMAGNEKQSAFGCTFEQLKEVIDAVADKTRIGVCIDTQHTFAGAFAPAKGFASTLVSNFDRLIGRSYLRGFHINNSLTAHGSLVDRHAPLKTGKIDPKEFDALMELGIETVYCLETSDPSKWKDEIRMLQHASNKKK